MMEVAYQTNGEGWAIQYVVVALALFCARGGIGA